jgi:hypothetical protein
MFRRFLWEGGKHSGRKLHLISWEKISKPILEGGLNFKNAHVQNLALGAKMLWNLTTGKPMWSKKALWKKYFRGPRERCIEHPILEKRGSPIFSLCQKTMPHFRPHLTWVPGNGKKINIWKDSIMGDPPLGLRHDLDRLKEWMVTQNLNTLWDISIRWNNEHKMWLRWGIANNPLDLEED